MNTVESIEAECPTGIVDDDWQPTVLLTMTIDELEVMLNKSVIEFHYHQQSTAKTS